MKEHFFFSENLLLMEMEKTQIYMNKSVYLRMLLPELIKIVIMNFGIIM